MEKVTIQLSEYEHGLRNPLKGFQGDFNYPYGTLDAFRIPWINLEESAKDGVERIIYTSDYLWGNYPQHNVKVIPRVYLHWDDFGTDTYHWPSDLETGDYTSKKFRNRLEGMISKLGEAWDLDPRVAYVEMGLIGKWGENHSPELSPKLRKIMRDGFTEAFPNTPVMIRYPEDFDDNSQFGLHWDSWGHPEEYIYHVPYLEGDWQNRWKKVPIGGETAFDWGTPLGENPTDAVVNNHEQIIKLIKDWHTNHLGWINNYDLNNPVAVANADEIQKAFGYRFAIDSVTYPTSVDVGSKFKFSFKVRNEGSTPLYGNWPVEIALHKLGSREIVWQKILPRVNTQKWLNNRPKDISRTIDLPDDLKAGRYAISLAILDPAGNLPAVKFANDNYWEGGRHPVGKIGIGKSVKNPIIKNFDNPKTDDSLHYFAESELSLDTTAINLEIEASKRVKQKLSITNTGNLPLAWRAVVDSFKPQDISILLVDDDGNKPNVRKYYTQALENLGYEYNIHNVEKQGDNGPDIRQLRKHDLVIWFSGNLYSDDKDSAGPNSWDEKQLRKYLKRDGKLILSSQDYLYDRGEEVNNFMRDYLGVEDAWNDFGLKTKSLTANTFLTGLGDLKLAKSSDVYHDALFPRGGQVIFSDSNTDYGQAIATDDTAYLAFPWENIYKSDSAMGEKVLSSLIDYLLPEELDWLSISDSTGGMNVQDKEDLMISFDTRGYQVGDSLTTNLEFWSNDANNPLVSVPVNVDVV